MEVSTCHSVLAIRSESGRRYRISRGEAIANAEIDRAGQRLVASVTVETVRELGLEVVSEVVAIIEASDVPT
jgi:molybdopterin-binding protein